MYRKAHITGAAGGLVYSRDVEVFRRALAHADRGKPRWQPDFDDRELERALDAYAGRERPFGALPGTVSAAAVLPSEHASEPSAPVPGAARPSLRSRIASLV